MVGAVSGFSPSTFLDQIKGVKAAPVVNTKPAAPKSETSDAENLATLLSSVSSSSQKGSLIADIIGSASTASSDPLAGVYNSFLYNKTSSKPLQQAIISAQQQAASTKANDANPLQKVLSSYHAGLNAYNKVAQQNAQNVLNANKGVLT